MLQGKLFRDLDNSADPVTPGMFVQCLRALHQQFDEQDEKGRHKQQDADECLSFILLTASKYLKDVERDSKLSDKGENAVDYLFGGEFSVKRTCDESPEEPVRVTKESFRKLKCYIDTNINYLYQGLEKSMEEKMEMSSETLGRPAIFTTKMSVARLPRILCIQFMRFTWGSKRQEGFHTKEARAQKVLRKVEYPATFDIKDFCTDELKNSMAYARAVLKVEKDKEMGLAKEEKEPAEKKAKKKKVKKAEKETVLEKPQELAIKAADPISTSGNYELFGVVTHKGRAADGGHYIGWVKDQGGTWWRYDDDKVQSVTADKIKELCGGGDFDMAYLVLYRRVDDLKDKPASWWKQESAAADGRAGSSHQMREFAGLVWFQLVRLIRLIRGSVDLVGYSHPLLQPLITLFTSTALAFCVLLASHADFLQPIQALLPAVPTTHCPTGLLLRLTLSAPRAT
eukprot:g80156.t1